MMGKHGYQLCYRSCSFKRFRLANGYDLAYQRTIGSKHLLPEETVRILDLCHCFAGLDTHTRRICGSLGYGPDQFSKVKKRLTELVEARLLVSDNDILSTARDKPKLNQVAQTETLNLGIVTSGRPSCLARCLQSYSANAIQYGRKVLFHIIDDTLDFSIRVQNQEAVEQIARQSGAKIVYFGITERSRLATELVMEGLPADVVNFALASPKRAEISTGANRNVLLLASVGSLIVSVDDDTVCDFVESPLQRTVSLALSSAYNPWVLSFYPDRASLLNSVALVQSDFLDFHLRGLGKTTTEFLQQFVSFSDPFATAITSDFMEILEKGTGRILVTQTGVAGDSGFGSPSGYLTAGGTTRSRLLQSESAYSSACRSREIVGQVNTITLTDSDFVMAGAIGLDNRAGLVPFFPLYRGQDAVFGAVIRKCFSESLTCHLPIAVFHTPPVHRCFAADAIWQDANKVELSSLILLCIHSFVLPHSSKDHTSRLRALGGYLIELGNSTDAEFWDTLQQLWFAAVSRTLTEMETQLRTDPYAPEFWRRDVKKYLNNLRQQVIRDDGLLPLDIANPGTEFDARRLVRESVKQYGRLLKSWPDIFTAAMSIRNRR